MLIQLTFIVRELVATFGGVFRVKIPIGESEIKCISFLTPPHPSGYPMAWDSQLPKVSSTTGLASALECCNHFRNRRIEASVSGYTN